MVESPVSECSICMVEGVALITPCEQCNIQMCLNCVLRLTEKHKFACPQCRKVRDPIPPASSGERKIHLPTESIQSFLHSDPNPVTDSDPDSVVSSDSDSDSDPDSIPSESPNDREEDECGPLDSARRGVNERNRRFVRPQSRPASLFGPDDEDDDDDSSIEEEESDPDELGSMDESDDDKSRKRALESQEVSSRIPRILLSVSGNSHLEILGSAIKYKTGGAVTRLMTDWYNFNGHHDENAEYHLLGIGRSIIGSIDVGEDGVVEILSKELLSVYLDIRVSGNGKVKFGECGTFYDMRLETLEHGVITILESISSIWVHKLAIFQHGAGSIGMFKALDELKVTNSGSGRVSVFQSYDCELGRNVNVGAGGVNEIIRC